MRGHRIDLVARIRDDEKDLLTDIQAQFARVVVVPHHKSGFWTGSRYKAICQSYARLRSAAREMLSSFRHDILYVEFTTSGAALAGGNYRQPRVIRIHDIWQKVFDQKARYAKVMRHRVKNSLFRIGMSIAEKRLYATFDQILAISEGDRRTLIEDFGFPPHKVGMLPTRNKRFAQINDHSCNEPYVVFVGAMNRPLNAEAAIFFVNEVLPYVRANHPNVKFQIVGSNPLPEVRALAAHPSVEVTGWVDSVEPYYAKACVFASPLLVGGGIIVKVMDALANGVPVVMTTASNLGIGATHGEHAFIADDPCEFAEYVCRLLSDRNLRMKLAANAQSWVNATYDFDVCVDRLEQTLVALASRTPSSH